MNTQPTELKSAFDVMDEVENAILELDELPRLLQLLIDNYHLDKREFTESEMYDLGIAGHTIYSVLYMVQNSLYDMSDKLNAISIKKDLDQEDTETAK